MTRWTNSTADRRIASLIAIMAAFLVALGIKLWWLQIVQNEKYTELALNNRTRLIREKAQRGRIVDRYGRPLSTVRPSFSLYLNPEDCPKTERKEVFERLSAIIDIDADEIERRYSSQKLPLSFPRKLAGNLDFESVLKIETHKFDLPGISVNAENVRSYPYGEQVGHLIGYVGEISQKQMELVEYSHYTQGDIIGQSGIESTFEKELAGKDGFRWVEVDSTGRIGRTLNFPQPKLSLPGSEIMLTIDLDLQLSAWEALGDWKGSIIAMDPRNGEILAMVSKPSFDPNLFSAGISQKDWQEINSNLDHPLLNRAIQVMGSPGSVFKIITAAAGLRSKTLSSHDYHFCGGSYSMFGTTFNCWKHGGHGTVNVVQAIEASCNVFFYQEGLRCGIDAISETAELFGFNAKTGIDLPNEKPGFIPNRAWKLKTKNDIWWPGETISVSIGQGGVLVTPIQLAVFISAVAQNGALYKPRTVRQISPNPNPEVNYQEPILVRRVPLTSESYRLLHEGLRNVVNGGAGTAKDLKMQQLVISGKTGTAQVISDEAIFRLGYTRETLPGKYQDHNWFVGYAPDIGPEISVVVYIENGGKQGARAKAKIAKTVFQKWLEISHQQKVSIEVPAGTDIGDSDD